MKTLDHTQMLAFPEAKDFRFRENPIVLADFLARKFCDRNFTECGMTEPFVIEFSGGTLTVGPEGAVIDAPDGKGAELKAVFVRLNELERQSPMPTVTVFKMAKNLLGAAAEFAKDGFKLADKDTLKLREEICGLCESWNGNARFGFGKCNICGCTSAKFKLAISKCPKGKWDILT